MLHGNTAAETEAMFLLLIQTVRSVRRKSVDVPSVLGERGCFGDQWRSFDYHHEAENRHVVLTGRTTQTHDHLHRHDASLQIKPTNSR